MRTPLIAGNWKMFKTMAEAKTFAEEFKKLIADKKEGRDVCICAPFTDLTLLKEMFEGTEIKVGAQNAHFEKEGAFTGEISIDMLKEIGIDYCIIGHSERRQYFNETDDAINQKLHKLFENAITPILCVGETYDQRQAEEQFKVVEKQVKADLEGLTPGQVSNMVIAYEPIWAIGTGLTASKEQANEMCHHIRKVVEEIAGATAAERIVIQYGGSVKPENATDIMGMEDVDGALVGGASLVPEKFFAIVNF